MAIKGAILGDIIGSQYEFKRPNGFDYKTALLLTDKCMFTDDTIMSIATKYAIEKDIPFEKAYQYFGLKYRNVGYGNRFAAWIDNQENEPYGSYGNGSAMRISYIADYFNNKEKVIEFATKSAECTHNHPEGIKGAVVTAVCIWMAKNGYNKDDILKYTIEQYPKDKYRFSSEYSLEEIKPKYRWDVTCQGSVPVAIRCVYESDNYTDFIRNVFSLDCDTDTLCAIGGGIAEELFGYKNDEVLKSADAILESYLDDYLLFMLRHEYGIRG